MERVYLKLYNSNDTYISPSNEIMDAVAVSSHFPASSVAAFVVQTDAYNEIMYGFYNLSTMKSKYNIDPSLNNVEAVQAIEDAMNLEKQQQEEAERAAALIPTPEERIAAALEFQNLNNLPDAE